MENQNFLIINRCQSPKTLNNLPIRAYGTKSRVSKISQFFSQDF